jgi:hypothetical protein
VLRRFYIAIAYSDRGRGGPQSTLVELPLVAVPPPPAGVEIAYGPDDVTVSWEPSGGVIGFLLDAPLPLEALDDGNGVPSETAPVAAPPTLYHVYRDVAPDPLVLPATVPLVPPGTVMVPRAVTPEPLAGLTFTEPVEFDRERCYRISAVRGGAEGAPTARLCVTPVDVFAPEPPTGLSSVVSEGAISLIWESSPDADVWGYVVLRGTTADATLLPLNAVPVIETQFTDTTVTPGTRYVYAVMALDSRLPVPNASAESARIEETAR